LYRRLMLGLVVLACFVSTADPAAAAGDAARPAATTARDDGWVPAPTPPFDFAAGVVCDFAVHGMALVDEVRTKVVATYPDGSKKRELATGALTIQLTNIGTGAATVVDAGGSAVFTYAPDGTRTWHVVGPVLTFFRQDLGNFPRGFYAVDGVYRIVFRPDGFKELTMVHGTVRPVCGDLD
jgi:hypothetical protein